MTSDHSIRPVVTVAEERFYKLTLTLRCLMTPNACG
jgi:hypothetical protein